MGRVKSKLGQVRRTRTPEACVRKAAHHLLETRPEASAGRALGVDPVLLAGPGAFIAGLLAFAPALALSLTLAAMSLYVGALSALRLAAALCAPRFSPARRLHTRDLPRITIIVALYKEATVLASLGACLSRLDYPQDKLEVLFALEACDTDTVAAARSLARRSPIKALVLCDHGPRTKPRALNYALQTATGELVAVYDAEDAPHHGQLRAAAEALAGDPGLGVVQAPLNWYNAADNWLTRQFALEYAAQFNALLPVLHRLGMPLPLGGTSNVFRRSALEASGGWDPFNVTEDADLGFRLARDGWRAGLIAPPTLEEAPVTAKAWTAQRSRWLKGHLISWLVQMRDPRGLADAAGLRALAGLNLTLLANVLSAAVHGPGLALWLCGLGFALTGAGDLLGTITVLMGASAYLAAMACAAAGARRAGVPVRALDLLTLPAYWLLQGPALWRALRELARQPYVWAKTRHGVSTARREAPHDTDSHARADGRNRGLFRAGGLALGAPG